MTTDFQMFAQGLSDDERGTLLSAIPLLTALVARADGKLTLREKIARWRTLIAARSELDPSFVTRTAAKDVELYLERLGSSSSVREDGASDMVRELRRIRAVIRKMPRDLQDTYERFLLEACLGVATASGRFLFFGEEISEAEREVLRTIVKELELRVEDPTQRAALDLD